MNGSITIVFCIYLIFSSSSYLCAMLQYPLTRFRSQHMEPILSINPIKASDQQLRYVNTIFAQENVFTRAWFKSHKKKLQIFLRDTIKDAHIKLVGSRKWGTNHLLSDIDGAIVTNESNHDAPLKALQYYYTQRYPHVQQCITKAKNGLPLFTLKNFSDPILGHMKIDFTIQNPETYNIVVTAMKERLSLQFINRPEKTRYALKMMIARYTKNEKEKQLLKEWTRILPHTARL